MTFQYVSVDEAIKRSGLRMVVVGGVPSPWGEAAKGILHIKGVDPEVLKVVDAEDLPFGEAVKRGVMAEPPNAEPKIEPIAAALRALDRDEVFVIVEQDLYPCDFDVPEPIARRTYDYLRSVGIGGDQ